MKIRKQKRRAGINISDSGALSDLAFLLIIFFIVIAVFNINFGFLLNLPRKNSVKQVHVEEIIKAEIDAAGTLFLEGQTITIALLREEIIRRLAVRPNMTFLLLIDPEAKYQKVVDIVNLAQELDVDNFSFRMKESSS